jgi:ABC-type amino acid transport substrate-binding protein
MTTVGYGDKAPTTLGGRLLAIVWMFTAIILVSSFTAAITSALTVSRLEGPVQGPDDLPGARVGSILASTSAAYLERRRIGFIRVETPADGLAALAADEIEAFVYDAPILQHLIKTHYEGTLRVLPGTFERQYYGFALPRDSPLREPVNRVLLQRIEQPAWKERLYRYLGE